MKQEVIMTRGIPSSGKTVWAQEMLSKYPGRYKNVCKDDLRKMLDNKAHSKHREQYILEIRDFLILKALDEGYSVIVSDTNINPIHEQHIRELVADKAEVKIQVFDVAIEECIKRDLERPNSVGEKVIRRMYKELKDELNSTGQFYIPDVTKPKAIICDIDGTLAIMCDRNPYDATLALKDSLNLPVALIVKQFAGSGYLILLVSGREDKYRDVTERWLALNKVPYYALYMRETGDIRHDAVTKVEIFNNFIREQFNVQFVLDDRNRVVEAWRALGVPCLQVAEGDF